MKYKVKVGSKVYDVDVEERGGGRFLVTINGVEIEVSVEGVQEAPTLPTPPTPQVTGEVTEKPKPEAAPSPPVKAPEGKVVKAPAPGKVIEVKVASGDEVKEDDVVVVLESMKMSIEVYAGVEGKVKEILVKPGEFVDLGQALVVLE